MTVRKPSIRGWVQNIHVIRRKGKLCSECMELTKTVVVRMHDMPVQLITLNPDIEYFSKRYLYQCTCT